MRFEPDCTEEEQPSRARAALERFGFASLPDFAHPGLRLAHLEDDVFPIFLIDGFLDADELGQLRALADDDARAGFAPARAGSVAGGRPTTRDSVAFRLGRSETASLRDRISRVLRTEPGAWSSGKYVRYAKGGQFETHMDGNLDFTVHFNRAVGEPAHANVVWTCFVYLCDVARGGETAWLKYDDDAADDVEFFRVAPRAGRAVFFPVTAQRVPAAFEAAYRALLRKPAAAWTDDDAAFRRAGAWRMDPLAPEWRDGRDAEIEFYPTHARHAGLPVADGEKHLLTFWCYTRARSDAAWLEAGSNDFVGDAARRGRPDVLLRADSAAEWS